MKDRKQIFIEVFSLYFIFSIAIFFTSGAVVYAATGEDAVADEIISLDVSEQPLDQVLAKISETTGYEFIIDDSWKDFAVTVSFSNLPLHRGLKMIFQTLNNAIIYRSDGKIKIIIYDDIEPTATTAGPSQTERLSEETASQPSSDSPSLAQASGAETFEKEENTETEAQASDESGDDAFESEESDDQNNKEEIIDTESSDDEFDSDESTEQEEQSSENEHTETEQSEALALEEESEDAQNTSDTQ